MALNNCLTKLIDHYNFLLHNDISDGTLRSEYQALRHAGTDIINNTDEYKRSIGSIDKNRAKNRYRDIIPFDATRVMLKEIPDRRYSDYINANYVQGVHGTNAYIAAQGPLPHTVNDFWRMIWEVEVKIVLMACNEFESKKMKCSRYWPLDEQPISFGAVSVTVKSEDVRDNGELIVRRLHVECAERSRTVIQYHYTAWPDHGIPHSMIPILDMLSSARNYQPSDEPPMVIHCSAGCGRTGTLIAIDYVWNLLKNGEITEDLRILDMLVDMRKQRQSLIQTSEQYEVVYRAVVELFQRQIQTDKNHLYENVSLADRNIRKSRTQQSIKHSSDIAQGILDSLNGEDVEPAPSGGVSDTPASAVADEAETLPIKSSTRADRLKPVAQYVNTETEGLFRPNNPLRSPISSSSPQASVSGKPPPTPLSSKPLTPISSKPTTLPLYGKPHSHMSTSPVTPSSPGRSQAPMSSKPPPTSLSSKAPSPKSTKTLPTPSFGKPPAPVTMPPSLKPSSSSKPSTPVSMPPSLKPSLSSKPSTPVTMPPSLKPSSFSKPPAPVTMPPSLKSSSAMIRLGDAEEASDPEPVTVSSKSLTLETPAANSRPPIASKPSASRPPSAHVPTAASVYSLADEITPTFSSLTLPSPQSWISTSSPSSTLVLSTTTEERVSPDNNRKRDRSTPACHNATSNFEDRTEILAEGGSSVYHLAQEISQIASGKQSSLSKQSSVDANQEYSYVDIAQTKKWTLQRQSSNTNNEYSLQSDIFGPEESQYSLADDDDAVAGPPVPTKTSDAYDDAFYAPVGPSSSGVFQIQASLPATNSNHTTASPGPTSQTFPMNPGSPSTRLPNLKAHATNFFEKFKSAALVSKISKAKTLTSTTNGRRGSSTSSLSSQEEVMYRGINVGYPNRMRQLNGEKGMPLSFKR